METTEQENTQEVQQVELLDGGIAARAIVTSQLDEAGAEFEEPVTPEAVQLVQSQEALDRMAEIEREYNRIVEQENK
jgi:hypothetical protein